MKDIEYFAPDKLEEALTLLSDYGSKATILAGGTDLVPQINYHECRPEILIYIGGLGQEAFQPEGDALMVAGTAQTAKLITNSWLQANAPALVEAACLSGCDATRSVATIGGNLANASPSADLAPPLLAADARVKLASKAGVREVPIAEFFTGPGETVMKPEELIEAVIIPQTGGNAVFRKLGKRKAMQCSVASVAACLDMDGATCKAARIALGAMAPTPIRCPEAEKMITGQALDATTINACAKQAVAESSPIDDQRATAWYRREAAVELVAQALAQASGIKL